MERIRSFCELAICRVFGSAEQEGVKPGGLTVAVIIQSNLDTTLGKSKPSAKVAKSFGLSKK